MESFSGRLRDELLNGELFHTLTEARVLTEQWRIHYNTVRPLIAVGYRPPALAAVTTLAAAGCSMASLRPPPDMQERVL